MGHMAQPRGSPSALDTTNTPKGTGKPSSLACLECRRKHLKCDGVMPICGRCLKNQVECLYTPSRRGYRPGAGPPSTAGTAITRGSSSAGGDAFSGTTTGTTMPLEFGAVTSGTEDTTSFLDFCPPLSTTTPEQQPPGEDFPSPSFTALRHLTSAEPGFPSISTSLPPPVSTATATQPPPLYGGPLDGDNYLLGFYYAFFHESHPILPPANLLSRLAPIPPCLENVLKFIGAHYAPNAPTDVYRGAAESALSSDTAEPTFYRVQALLLLSIALHARNERSESVESFGKAATLALKLGMNRRSFGEHVAGGGDDVVRLESLRRTWWELYIVDPQFSAFDRTPLRIAHDVVIDVPLPCDDASYAAGMHASGPASAARFYNRIFGDDEDENAEYSSYCYVIEATHILRRVLALPHASSSDQLVDHVESVDARIGSWFRHLPESRTLVLSTDGSVDQNLFRAYMLMHCASIYLHLPRSGLLSTTTASAASATISCVLSESGMSPASTPLIHTTKALKAANGIANLATIRSSVVKHTPFFVCGLVLAAVVQLCACSTRASASIEPRTDRIALIIGELKTLNRTWPISRRVMQQIKAVAREVLEIGVHTRPHVGEIENSVPDIDAIVSSDAWLGDVTMT